MTKKELKELIKECLMEILVEGVGKNLHTLVENKRAPSFKAKPSRRSTRKVIGSKAPRKKMIDEHMQSSINELTPDPIMASIFADTAATTLVEQNVSPHNSARGNMGRTSDEASKAAQNMEPMQMDGAPNWAKLAFD